MTIKLNVLAKVCTNWLQDGLLESDQKNNPGQFSSGLRDPEGNRRSHGNRPNQ